MVENTLIKIDIDVQRQRAVAWSALLDDLVEHTKDSVSSFAVIIRSKPMKGGSRPVEQARAR
jgi:hypothetical protein